jgi:hypothetical protein
LGVLLLLQKVFDPKKVIMKGVVKDNSNDNDDDLDFTVSPLGDGAWESLVQRASPSHSDAGFVAVVGGSPELWVQGANPHQDDKVVDGYPEQYSDNDDDGDIPLDSLAIENLRLLFRRERAEDYKVADYLGIRSAIMIQNHRQHNTNKKRKRGETLPQRPAWRMDACNRWEIGEWCYGCTLFCWWISILVDSTHFL